MRCGWVRSIVAAALLFVLAACGGSQNSLPVNPPAPNPPGAFSVDGYPAKFTEYPVPGVALGDVTLGPDGAIWFSNFSGFFASTIAGGEITGTGAVTLIKERGVPDTDRTMTSGSLGIAAAFGKVWMLANDPDYQREVFIVGMTPGVSTVTDFGDMGFECCAFTMQKFATDKEGHLWMVSCIASCTSFSSFISRWVATPSASPRSTVFLGNLAEIYIPSGIGFGTDGNTYVTAVYDGAPMNDLAPNEGFVFKISPAMQILAQYPLRVGSDPQGIAGGPDGNLWIAERNPGMIVRMTPGGQTTDFPLANNALPFQIIAGHDGALWFTDPGANALGRITTRGAITEYPIPTPGAGPFGLVTCPAACDSAHGRIWFSERGAGKIAKFEF